MTSRPQSAKRASVAPTVPPSKPPCQIHSLAIISDKAQIIGTEPVKIGENTVLHPYAKIVTQGGSVVIGKNCVIGSNAVVGVTKESGQGDVILGDGVNIESNAVVEAKTVGDGTAVEVSARLGRGAVIGRVCNGFPLTHMRSTSSSYAALQDHTLERDSAQRGPSGLHCCVRRQSTTSESVYGIKPGDQRREAKRTGYASRAFEEADTRQLIAIALGRLRLDQSSPYEQQGLFHNSRSVP